MPPHNAPEAQDVNFDDYMRNFVPTSVEPKFWTTISPDAIALVGRAGPMTKLRINADLSVLANMTAHLVERGRPVTLDEALSDRSEVSFDAHMQATSPENRHRQNQRSRLRRLRKVHAKGGTRPPRRTPSQRIANLASHHLVGQLANVIEAAELTDDPNGADFLAAVAFARAKRGIGPSATSRFRRADAWAFAAENGMMLTATRLGSIVTQEVLAGAEPLAVLASTFGLSPRDLELGMTGAVELPSTPDASSAQLLRGASGG